MFDSDHHDQSHYNYSLQTRHQWLAPFFHRRMDTVLLQKRKEEEKKRTNNPPINDQEE